MLAAGGLTIEGVCWASSRGQGPRRASVMTWRGRGGGLGYAGGCGWVDEQGGIWG